MTRPLPNAHPALAALVAACGLAFAGGLPVRADVQSASPASARVKHAKPVPARLTIPTAHGPREFLVDSPDALDGPAARDDSAEADESGKPRGLTPGFRLTSRVIIRAADPAGLPALVGPDAKLSSAAPPEAAPDSPTRAFHYADAPSIRAAAELAERLAKSPGVELAYLDIEWPKALRTTIPSDPQLPAQWHLINTATPAADTNADAAWKAGFTGAGVTVGVLEGGWDTTHEDLAANHHAAASQTNPGFSDHGTSTAGLVAAVANNNRGGVGVAHGAMISKQYYGTASDINAAFAFANNLNHIKTNSWGPFDNGRIAQIDPLELAGIEDAALNGRAGKGVVIVWAGGNGGQNNNDRVDYDPYASNRFAIAVGAIDSMDRRSLYSEPGSALMLVTTSDYDLFSSADLGIFTTAGFNSYTSNFGGTSAAAPIAAGVCALVLQANPNLTWRDVQHVLIRSARQVNPADPSWTFNASGTGSTRRFSELFGFGAIDAGAAVTLAQSWINRPPQTSITPPAVALDAPIPDNNPAGVSSSVQVTGQMLVERAQVTLNIPHASIGQLRITLTSPGGTQALLAGPRFDTALNGYNNFTFSPARFWEERAAGTWTLTVADLVSGTTGTLANWQLRLHGYTPACPCDWNVSNGVPTLQDLFDYLTSYFTGRGDFDGDAATNPQDLFDFLDCWFDGCA
ncbi:MAG: S8 family serine peptidase [Phycisphaerales bacterium]